MKLFTGLSRTDYQDLFRAIGAMIDAEGWRDVRLWEHEDGLVVQGQRAATMAGDAGYQTILLTDANFQEMLEESYRRRTGE